MGREGTRPSPEMDPQQGLEVPFEDAERGGGHGDPPKVRKKGKDDDETKITESKTDDQDPLENTIRGGGHIDSKDKNVAKKRTETKSKKPTTFWGRFKFWK